VAKSLQDARHLKHDFGYFNSPHESPTLTEHSNGTSNGMQKAAFMRESVNTVFQGSAADLIKLSMNQIDSMIQDEKLDAFMLLQIHDELIFEVKEEKVEEIAKRFVHTMENVLALDVPLECSVSVGDSWGELK